jgi:tetratricopeptide (TPR) repeat protein
MLRRKLLSLIPFCLWVLLGSTPTPGWGSQADLEKALALNEKVLQFSQAGSYQEALPLAKKAIQLFEKALGPEHPGVCQGYHNLAELYRGMGAYNQALPNYHRALQILEKAAPDHPLAAVMRNNLVRVYMEMGAYDPAHPLYDQAFKIREKVLGSQYPNSEKDLNKIAELYPELLKATALSEKAVKLYEAGYYKKALPLALQAFQIREKVLGGDHDITARSLNNLGAIYQEMGEYRKALQLFQRALKITENAFGPDAPDTARSLNNLGNLYQEMGEYGKSLQLFQRALKITEKLGPEHPDTARDLGNLALLYLKMGIPTKGIPLARQSLQITENVLGSEHPLTAICLDNLAGAYQEMGVYGQALPLSQRALKIRERVFGPEHPHIAGNLLNLGAIYEHMGDYDKALPLLQRALEISEKTFGPEHIFTATCRNNLAGFYEEIGGYDKALTLYKQVMQIVKKELGPEHPKTATTLSNIAKIYFDMGAYDQARTFFHQSLQIMKKVLGPEHPLTILGLENLGCTCLYLKDFKQAETLFRQGKSKSGLVELDLAMGRPEEALRRMDEKAPWNSVPTYQVQFNTQKGLALAGVGRLPEAAISLCKAVQGTETLRQKVTTGERVSFLGAGGYGRNIRPYRGLVAVLAQMALTGADLPPELRPFGPEPRAAAFYFAESAKARSMLESLAQAGRQTSRGELPEDDLRQREQNLLNQIAANEGYWEKALQGGKEALREALDKREMLSAKLQTLIKEIRKSDSRYAALHYPQPLPAWDLPLHDKEVLLEYALGEKASFVFVVRKGGIQNLIPINLSREALEEKIQDFMEPLLNDRMGGFSVKKGKELFDLLLAKPLMNVKEGEKIIMVPDGKLGLLPFEALVMQAGGSFADSIFMGDRHTLTYRQSATVLALQRTLPEQTPSRPLFALGNPVYNEKDKRYQAWKQEKPAPQLLPDDKEDVEHFAYKALASQKRWGKITEDDREKENPTYKLLLDSEVEVREVAKIWDVRPQAPDVLLGVSANETQLRQSPLHEYRYLLFATHAEVGGKVQGKKEPFILLGQVENKGKDDGFLTLSKVLDLKLQAQMVVLSACVTGTGDVMEGEGVVNFARAFQYAGARSVMVSLWAVKSKVAVEYMKKFFGYLKEGRGRAEALRLARQDIKTDYSNPFAWAVFILHGEG